MMIVTVMIVMIMGMSVALTIRMGFLVDHSGRHSCESAESEKPLEEKCHALR